MVVLGQGLSAPKHSFPVSGAGEQLRLALPDRAYGPPSKRAAGSWTEQGRVRRFSDGPRGLLVNCPSSGQAEGAASSASCLSALSLHKQILGDEFGVGLVVGQGWTQGHSTPGEKYLVCSF